MLWDGEKGGREILFSNFCYKCVCGVNAEVALDYFLYV